MTKRKTVTDVKTVERKVSASTQQAQKADDRSIPPFAPPVLPRGIAVACRRSAHSLEEAAAIARDFWGAGK